MAPIFDNLVIAICGKWQTHSQSAFKENIKDNGGKVADKITDATTHLIVSEWEYNHRAIKVREALAKPDIKIVDTAWVLSSVDENVKLDEAPFFMDDRKSANVDKKRTPLKKSYLKQIDEEILSPSEEAKSDREEDKNLPPAKRRKQARDGKSKLRQSQLPPEVQELMKLIFSQEAFAAHMSEMNYDARVIPLDKLSMERLSKGFAALTKFEALFADPTNKLGVRYLTFDDAADLLSDAYYKWIPHNFGGNSPVVIRDTAALKKEVELLESLMDMKIANGLMEGAKEEVKKGGHLLDRQFAALGMEEMTPLDPESAEYIALKRYLILAHGPSHHFGYELESIFRIERAGEEARFEASPYSRMSPEAKIQSDRRLLWHGSRTARFGALLSQGLRVSPPEAPGRAYDLGKGIYLRDLSSNSARDCAYHASGGVGLLLLCEAELGTSAYTLYKHMNHDLRHDEAIKSGGALSVQAKGHIDPSRHILCWQDAGNCVDQKFKNVKMPDFRRPFPYIVPKDKIREFIYNEYVVLNEAQIQMRYLFRVKITDNDDWRRSAIDREYQMDIPEQYVQTLLKVNEWFGAEWTRYLTNKAEKEAKELGREKIKRTRLGERLERERLQASAEKTKKALESAKSIMSKKPTGSGEK